MRRLLAVAVLALASLAACAESDDPRPAITTSGLHQPCPDNGCAVGQECIVVAQPGTTDSFCEIECEEDSDCPEETYCNVPPLIPDQVAYICD